MSTTQDLKFTLSRDGVYLVQLRDAAGTPLGEVVSTPRGWKARLLDGTYDLSRTASFGTRKAAAERLIHKYELANGLRDVEGRHVAQELETGLWFVANHYGGRESSRWADKADAIAKLASLQTPAQSGPTTPAIDVGRVIQIAVEDADKIALTANGETRTSLRRYRLARLFGNYTLRQLMNANSPQERNDERSRLGRPLRKDDFVNLLVSKALRSLAAAEEPEFLRIHHCGTTLQERPAEGWDSEDMAGYAYFCPRCSGYTNTFQRSELRSEVDDRPTAAEQLAAEEPVEFEVAVTPVMVWPHGMVETGHDKLSKILQEIAYGHGNADDMPTLYVTQGGGLERAEARLLVSQTEENDWIDQQIGIFAGDADEPVITIGLRIDGRV